jgi:hypothetical protein
MAAVAPGYASASDRGDVSAVEMFISIYEQLTPETRLEVADILVAMALEGQASDDGLSSTITSILSGINDTFQTFLNSLCQQIEGSGAQNDGQPVSPYTDLDAVESFAAMIDKLPGLIESEGADEALESFMSQFGQLDAEWQQKIMDIISAIESDTPAPSQSDSDNNVTNVDDSEGAIAVDTLRQNPKLLTQGGIEGVEVTGLDLFTDDYDGMLSETSKIEVNKLIGYLSDMLGSIEVVVNVYVDDSGNCGVHLTSGDENSAGFYPMENTIYSAHVHTNGVWLPSPLDRENELPGAEDAIVPGDGVAGNETGEYFQYA